MAQVVEDRPGTEAPDASVIRSSIETVQGAVVEFDRISAGLAALEKAHPKDIACDVGTPAGMKQAIAGRAAWREPRIAVEKARKAAKAPVLALGRSIDGFATALEIKLLAGEEHYDQQIKAEEERRERERQAKIEAEAARVSLIRELISAIGSVAVRAVGLPSADVEAKIKLVVAMEIGAKYGEFVDEAKAVHADTLARLREIHTAALASETEAARIVAERVELEQLRRADVERRAAEEKRAEIARKAEEERLAAARRQLEADQRAQREAQARLDAEAAERRRAADQEAADRRAEEDRQARAQREAEAQRIADGQAALRREQEARERTEREAREEAARQAEAERAAAAHAQSLLERAAKPMLDALLLWRTVDNARLARSTDAFKQAVAAREAAIATATEGPEVT